MLVLWNFTTTTTLQSVHHWPIFTPLRFLDSDSTLQSSASRYGIRMITKQSKEITHHSLLSLCYACVQKQTNPTTIYTTGCDIWLLKTRIKKTIFKKTTRRRRWLACDLALARASLRSKGKEGGAVAPALVQASVLQLLWDTQSDPSKKNVPPFLSQNQTQQQNRKGFFWPIIPFWKTLQH